MEDKEIRLHMHPETEHSFSYDVAPFVLRPKALVPSLSVGLSKEATLLQDRRAQGRTKPLEVCMDQDVFGTKDHRQFGGQMEMKDSTVVPVADDRMVGDILEHFISLEDPVGTLEVPGELTELEMGRQKPSHPSKKTLFPTHVPWRPLLDGITSPSLRLHREIVEFVRLLRPSAGEDILRRKAFHKISSAVTDIWPSATLEVFGSFATDLYLPTSDIDAVILNSGCNNIQTALRALAKSLSRKKLAENIVILSKARVPIVKFEEMESGYKFDISFDVANGPQAAGYVSRLMDSLPPMRHLVLVLKVFLQQRDLNEVYSGGIGSYALLVMVAAFLQTHPSRTKIDGFKTRSLETNLGILLIDFFRLYGRLLNYSTVGVSCRLGGKYFKKRGSAFYQEQKPSLLAVEDPNDPSNDLGKNSYNIGRARIAFDWAYSKLVAQSRPGDSLLERIIRLDPALFLRNGLCPSDVGLVNDDHKTENSDDMQACEDLNAKYTASSEQLACSLHGNASSSSVVAVDHATRKIRLRKDGSSHRTKKGKGKKTLKRKKKS